MRTLHSILATVADIIRLRASFDLSGVAFNIDAEDVSDDLAYGRS
jgi:hypothetical protein